MKHSVLASSFAFIAVVISATFAPAEVPPIKKGALVTISANFEVKASPSKVWSTLCSAAGFRALSGFTPDAGDKAHSFTKLGDSIAAQIWTDKGGLIVTGFDPERELRVTWEPANANYLCAKRIVLKPAASGTTIEYTDRYTDDQPNVDETAKQVREETVKAIEAFRKLVEK